VTRSRRSQKNTPPRPPPVPQVPIIASPPPTAPIKSKSTIRSKLWAGILVFATLIGILSGIGFFAPSVSVDFGDLADPSDLMSVVTTVKNDGAVTLYDLSVEMGVCNIESWNPAGKPIFMRSDCKSTGELTAMIAPDKWQHHKMQSGEKYTVALSDLFSSIHITNVTYADISIAVNYRPWYFPFIHRVKQFRTVGGRDQKGRYEWRFVPLDD